jgi:hypothetical protein
MLIYDLFESRTPLLEKLRPHAHDEKMFVTFTDINKIGINPGSHWDDPFGIYAYPIKDMFESFESMIVPFAGDRKLAYILRANGYMEELNEYSEADLEANIDVLNRKYYRMFTTPIPGHEAYDEEKYWESTLTNWYARWSHQPGEALWRITERMANFICLRYPNRDSRMVWNSLLRSLGNDALCDRGAKIISTNEPAQAVFLHAGAVQIIEASPNDLFKQTHYPEH